MVSPRLWFVIRNDARQRLHCNESQGSVDVTTFLYFGVACDDRHRPVRPHLDYGRTRGLVHRRCNVRSRPVSYRQRSGTHGCPSIDICFDTDSSHVYHDHATARFSPNRAVRYSHRGELHADAGYGMLRHNKIDVCSICARSCCSYAEISV